MRDTVREWLMYVLQGAPTDAGHEQDSAYIRYAPIDLVKVAALLWQMDGKMADKDFEVNIRIIDSIFPDEDRKMKEELYRMIEQGDIDQGQEEEQ